jgi:hypothetical protein
LLHFELVYLNNMLKTGSAHSILKMLPLLDHLQEENDSTLTFVLISMIH